MPGNVLVGAVGLLLTSCLTSLVATRILLPMLLQPAPHLPSGMIFLIALTVSTICIGSASGTCFARRRQAVSTLDAVGATTLFVLIQVALPIIANIRLDVVAIGAAALLGVSTVLAFWLPLMLKAWQNGRLGAVPLGVYAIALVLPLAIGLLPVPLHATGIQPLHPNPMRPRFGDQATIPHALSAGTAMTVDPARRAKRAAVLTAAVQLCSDPRDSQAWFELRRTLLVFLNSNVQGWHHPLAETITVDGSGLDASKHLDAPALHVFRQALAAQIIRLDELPEAVRRELAFRHIAQVGPGSAATGAWTCVR